MQHLRRAKRDENILVQKFWSKGYPALRISGSGCGFFKGDVLVFGNRKVEIHIVRRSENNKPIVFSEKEISDVKKVASMISELIYPTSVEIYYDAHFPKRHKWVRGLILDFKEVIVK